MYFSSKFQTLLYPLSDETRSRVVSLEYAATCQDMMQLFVALHGEGLGIFPTMRVGEVWWLRVNCVNIFVSLRRRRIHLGMS